MRDALAGRASGRVDRLPRAEAFALGAGLNARGALEIVIATVGLSLGVLNTRSSSALAVPATRPPA